MTLAHAGPRYQARLYHAPVIVISLALWRSGAREDRAFERPEDARDEHESVRAAADREADADRPREDD